MGRIADALKKAQAERAEKMRIEGVAVIEQGGADADASAHDAAAPAYDPIVDPPRMTTVADDEAAPDAVAAPRTSNSPCDLLCVSQPGSVIAEQYRAIRTWIQRHNMTAEHRSLVVTSSVAAEGKTTTTINLGVCLAEVRHLNILLIDGDLRHGTLASRMGAPAGPGLRDLLAGRCALSAATHRTSIPNLSVIPAGQSSAESPTELLSSRASQVLFDEARERYHYVLVDSPPIQSSSDVAVIGGMCTGVLMIVRMHRTPQAVAQQSVRWLQANNLEVVGCVLTGAAHNRGRLAYPDRYGGPSGGP